MQSAWLWIKEYQADIGRQAFRGNGKLTSEQEEIRRLKAQTRQLELVRQILKKAAVDSMGERNEIFVHHPEEEDLPGWLDVPTIGCKS